MQNQNGVDVRVREQYPQCGCVALAVRVADDVDRICMRPGRRQDNRFSLASVAASISASRPPRSISLSVASTPTPPAVGEDREPVARHLGTHGERFHGIEHLVEIVGSKDSRALERRVIDRIDAGKSAGVRRRRFRRRRVASGLDGDDGLQARRSARADRNLRGWVTASI